MLLFRGILLPLLMCAAVQGSAATNAVPHINGIERITRELVVIHFDKPANRIYEVQYKDPFRATNWYLLDVAGVGAEHWVAADTWASTNHLRMYRLHVR